MDITPTYEGSGGASAAHELEKAASETPPDPAARFRALVQSVDRSLEEARRRRLGIDQAPATPSMLGSRLKATRIVRTMDESRQAG